MHYLVYFGIATPVLLGWLFWAAETIEPPKPISIIRAASDVLRQDDGMTQRGQNAYYPQFPRDPEATGLTISTGTPKATLAAKPRTQPAPKLLMRIKREVSTARAEAEPGDAREGQLVEYQQPFGQNRFSIH
jgi:hypothetical protein